MTLGRNQARVVAARLRLIEQELASIERLVNADERGTLYELIPLRLSQDADAAVRALLDEGRRTIAVIADTFALPRQREPAQRRISAVLAASWESLGEIDSAHLAGYGSVDPRLPPALGPSIEHLIQLMLDLQEIVASAPPG